MKHALVLCNFVLYFLCVERALVLWDFVIFFCMWNELWYCRILCYIYFFIESFGGDNSTFTCKCVFYISCCNFSCCIFCIVLNTGSSPICILRYHSLIHIKNNSYFVGIGPIRDIELICIFELFFPLCIVSNIGLSTII